MTTRTFLGIPIEGDITETSKRVAQRPIEELQPILQAVLDDESIVEFGWTQYTPYFNDGEPCTFGISTPWIRTAQDGEDADTWGLEMYNHPSLGKRDRTYNRDTKDYGYQPYKGPDEARFDRCKTLSDAIEGGAFEDVLLEAFGDHAEVVVRRDGIQVEFYSHD